MTFVLNYSAYSSKYQKETIIASTIHHMKSKVGKARNERENEKKNPRFLQRKLWKGSFSQLMETANFGGKSCTPKTSRKSGNYFLVR